MTAPGCAFDAAQSCRYFILWSNNIVANIFHLSPKERSEGSFSQLGSQLRE
jgi:hypothetical protein